MQVPFLSREAAPEVVTPDAVYHPNDVVYISGVFRPDLTHMQHELRQHREAEAAPEWHWSKIKEHLHDALGYLGITYACATATEHVDSAMLDSGFRAAATFSAAAFLVSAFKFNRGATRMARAMQDDAPAKFEPIEGLG